MTEKFIEVRYKGRIIIIGVKWSKNPRHYETNFTIWGKQTGNWEIDIQSSLDRLFEKKDDAFLAGHCAAQNWIDERDDG